MEEVCAAPLDEPHRLVLEDLAKGKESEIKKKIQQLTRERNEITNKRDDFESDVSQKMEERAVLLKKVENAEKQSVSSVLLLSSKTRLIGVIFIQTWPA